MRQKLLVGFTCALLLSAASVPVRSATGESSERIRTNDNRSAAGTFARGTQNVDIVSARGEWYPDGVAQPGIPIEAFGERGRALQIPGPLIRVAAGTDIRLRVRNELAHETLTVHNLVDLPAHADRPIAIASGTERIVRIHAYAPGTYYYWGSTTPKPLGERFGDDSQLSGAIVVDPPGARVRDRIFVLGNWDNVYRPDGSANKFYQVVTINGRAWPATERLSYARGEAVRWRIVNPSAETHPLHLHAFPFTVLERGDGTSSHAGDADREITERVASGETMAMRWIAERAGTWMFHCHNAFHVIPHVSTAVMLAGKPTLDFKEQLQHLGGMPAAFHDDAMMAHPMGGMILSVTVRPDARVPEPRALVPRRHLILTVEPQPEAPAPPGAPIVPAMTYALSEDGRAIGRPGDAPPPLVLTQNEPVRIDVVNHLSEATSVHWHGIEMHDPYYDGVVGFRGLAGRPAPSVEPGASFDVRFTPPRAGTFIYHAHADDGWQIVGGLAGPLIVLSPGRTFDPSTDHVVLLTSPRDVRDWATHLNVNGSPTPEAIQMQAGVANKLRLINMTAFAADTVVRLTPAGASGIGWTLVAKDGMDLVRPHHAAPTMPLSIGQTRDLVVTPAAGGTYALEIALRDDGPVVTTIPIHVTEASVSLLP